MHNLGLLPHVELMVNPMQSSHRLGALTFAKFIGGYLTSMFHIITYKQYLSLSRSKIDLLNINLMEEMRLLI
jgi:hypothetical protein